MQSETSPPRQIFRGRLLTLHQISEHLPSGRSIEREVVVHPGAVAIIAIHADTIFLVRQIRIAAGKMTLEIPAGTLRPGEDPADAAARELEEEIGYQARRWKYLFQGYVSPGYSTELMHFFLAEDLRETQQHLEEDEVIEVVRVPAIEIWKYVERGEIVDNKTIIGALWVKHFLS